MGDNNWRSKALQEVSTEWMNDAKCRQEKKDLKLFFEEFEKSNGANKEKMIRFCNSCEVREACYQHAITVGETGLWGGAYFAAGKPKNAFRTRFLEDTRDMSASQKMN